MGDDLKRSDISLPLSNYWKHFALGTKLVYKQAEIFLYRLHISCDCGYQTSCLSNYLRISKRKSTTLRTIMLALYDYRLMTYYKFSISFKWELLLGQSKTPTASRRSRSLVFAVCCVHGSLVHEHGWSCNGWFSRCGTAWVSRISSKFRQVVMFVLDLDQSQFAITGKVSKHHDGSFSLGMSSLDTWRMDMPKGTFLTPSAFAL